MANLTVTVAVSTGTQYITGNTSSIYTFDGSQPASFTFPWVASGTVRLEQSGSSNDGHPLIFSTSNSAVLATMKAGIISSGVTYYLDGSSNQSDYTNTTTFNAATTRYIEIAPTSETDFYFACWVHGIGMGGIMDMTQNTWGALSWSDHDWGDQDTVTVRPSGLSITASLGDPKAYHEHGWGRSTWGSDDWGDFSLTVVPTGLSITGSLGTLSASSLQGWGRNTFGNGPWGESNSPVVSVSGFPITASLGTLPYAQSESGWGRDEWGIGNWGENTTTVADITGFEMTGHQGPDAWGQAPWNEMITWGGGLTCETTQLSVEALTGIEGTLSLGTPTISRLDMIFDITGPAAMGAGLGTPGINDGSDHSQGLASLLITGSVGSLGHEMAYDLTGIEATMTLNAAGLVIDDTQLVNLTGIEITGSLGSFTLPDMAVGLSGIAITGSVGSLTITDMQVGISGLEMSGSLGSGGVSPLHYKDVDITGNTSYTYVEHSA